MNSYEEDYAEANAAIQRDLSTLRNSLVDGAKMGSSERSTLLKTIQTTLAKLKESCNNIELEANDLIPAKRTEAKARVAEYKRTVFQYEKDFTRAKTEVAKKEREELLDSATGGGNIGGGENAANDVERARQQMANNTSKMKQGNDTLKRAEQLVEDSHNLADGTIDELGKQREKLQRIKQSTAEADEEINQARKVITRMQKVMIQNKAVMIIIIGVLLLMIFIIAYVKYGGSDTATPAPTIAVPTQPPCGNDCIPEGSGSFDPAGEDTGFGRPNSPFAPVPKLPPNPPPRSAKFTRAR